MSLLHMCADSASQCCMAGLGPLSLCYECVQLLFLRICEDLIKPPVAIASSRIPDKSPESLPVHFLPEIVLQSQANGASGPPCSLVAESTTLTGDAPNQHLWRDWGVGRDGSSAKAIHHSFALFLPTIIFLNIFFSVYYMPVIYFWNREVVASDSFVQFYSFFLGIGFVDLLTPSEWKRIFYFFILMLIFISILLFVLNVHTDDIDMKVL